MVDNDSTSIAGAEDQSDENTKSDEQTIKTKYDQDLDNAEEKLNKGLFEDGKNILFNMYKDINDPQDAIYMIKAADLLNHSGLISDAEKFCNKAIEITSSCTPENVIIKKLALHILAVIAGEACAHDIAHSIMSRLVEIFPEYNDVWMYCVFHMNYDPDQTQQKLKEMAEEWIKALVIPETKIDRPKPKALNGRPLRIGYVSADFTYHPVGFLIRDVIVAHDHTRIEAFAYDNGPKEDNIIKKIIALGCTVKNVRDLNDDELAAMIRQDEIDVLVDLSGYTSGGRLGVFAREPAPLMVSWLGYWATTGLKAIDAVLLDKWHAPEWMDQYFTEKIVRLPHLRFCYQPLAGEPQVNFNLPCIEKGYVTFASFNNTLKINSTLLDCWAEILHKVENSHLVLKWKTFHDQAVKERIRAAFARRGISDTERIEFQGWSPLYDMLKEYYNVDIALDTFPFTGGMTTFNALWMGIPVVTLQGKSVIGRQGHAVLSELGLEELSAENYEHYINIAQGLAKNIKLLQVLRITLRERMRKSSVVNVNLFTKNLEDCFYTLYEEKLKDVK